MKILFRWKKVNVHDVYFSDVFWNVCKLQGLYNLSENLVNWSRSWYMYYLHGCTLWWEIHNMQRKVIFMEFNKTGQSVLISMGHNQVNVPSNSCWHVTLLWSPYPSVFPFFLLKPKSLSFSALSSSPTHPIIHLFATLKYSSPVSHNVSRTQLELPPLCLKGVPALTHHGGCSWDTGTEALLGHPWEGPENPVSFSESLIWVLSCLWALYSSGLVKMGLWWADGS